MDVVLLRLTDDHYGRPIKKEITHTVSYNDTPQPNGDLKKVVRKKIMHYRRVRTDVSDPVVCMCVTVNTSVHRKTSTLTGVLVVTSGLTSA